MLDLGCGAGRHCIYLGKNGFDVIGVDVSKSALKITKKWIQKEKLKNVAVVRGTMDAIPFGDRHFDAVISVSVIHHALKKDIAHTVNEIRRVLRKMGLFIANLASVEDHRYGEGEEVEAGTYRILEHFGKNCEELHHFFTKQEVSQLLTRFAKTKIETHFSEKNKQHCYWKITASK